ncbi:bifunctional helix-turn-helix transcriptional regulator/GNAT family N-acetyltransferase [[Clostridium] fimetarium]|uniref:DNA-binding transcriptional regulator, MarR family n=1 Tax=[Clostridium] fimetarium TaxID=99656 RepID=A0A1I0QZU4_9FIRM|nr:helix-turn-helix domain-containing GNAT family N-acetyltransferase [[Clostridium] fimetarium]SEW33531.1 DNA-binding transcriptional regulator, MarR family [[Clostridium] fimetarium]
MNDESNTISQIRSFNRFYTNVLGLLDQHILDSEYSLTEVRVLHEICKTNQCTAIVLGNQLEIDRSYMSRIIKHLEKGELITKLQSKQDNRVYYIALTEKGLGIIVELNKKSDEQISQLFKHLGQEELSKVLEAMSVIKKRVSESLYPITIRNFVKDDIEYLILRHQILYPSEYDLSSVFVNNVNTVIHQFIEHFDASKECILIAEVDGQRLGSIAIAKSDTKTAQLRFFLLEPEARGKGIGKKLIENALEFCREKGYTHIFLETISRLKTARYIYKSKGFKITHTHENPAWGKDVIEERWDLDL